MSDLLIWPRAAVLGVQHVLLMLAGSVAVPLTVGAALGLPPDDVSVLIGASLAVSGFATLVQAVGMPLFGCAMPVVFGASFTAVAPMLAIVAGSHGAPGDTLLAVLGGSIFAGLIGILAGYYIGALLKLFPPLVTGTVVVVAGLSLLRTGYDWVQGGLPTLAGLVDKTAPPQGPDALPVAAIAAVAALALWLLHFWVHRVLGSVAILIALAAATLAAGRFGLIDLSAVGAMPETQMVQPYPLGVPPFALAPALGMAVAVLVTMLESAGALMATAAAAGHELDQKSLTRAMRGIAAATLLGGVAGAFPAAIQAQNAGLVAASGRESRGATGFAGALLIALGLLPNLAAVVAAVPVAAVGGAVLALAVVVIVTGLRALRRARAASSAANLIVVAAGVIAGAAPLLAPGISHVLPVAARPLLGSGILLAMVAAAGVNAAVRGRVAQPPPLASA